MTRLQQFSVYRFFDASGQLLYVGMTADLPARMRQHAKDKTWWPEVARTTSEVHPTEKAAAAAEATAIVAERPLHNIAGTAVDIEALKGALGLRERWTVRLAAAKVAGRVGRLRRSAVTAVLCLAWLVWFAPFAYRFVEWAGVDMPVIVTAGFAAAAVSASLGEKPRFAITAVCSLPGLAGQELAVGAIAPTAGAAKDVLSAAATVFLVGALTWLVATTRAGTCAAPRHGRRPPTARQEREQRAAGVTAR